MRSQSSLYEYLGSGGQVANVSIRSQGIQAPPRGPAWTRVSFFLGVSLQGQFMKDPNIHFEFRRLGPGFECQLLLFVT